MIYYLQPADFHEGLRQLSSSVKPILNHFPSLLPLPATSDFNEVVFPVRSINWDSCGPGIPEPQRPCVCRDCDLWFAARHRELPQQHRKSWQNFPGHPLWCPSPLQGMAWGWGPTRSAAAPRPVRRELNREWSQGPSLVRMSSFNKCPIQ